MDLLLWVEKDVTRLVPRVCQAVTSPDSHFWSPLHISPDELILLRDKVQTQLYLCKILGFYGGDYEEWRFLECYTV
jgi:hypothetical protein